MSQLNVDNIRNRTGSNGGPNFPSGITVAVGQTAYIHGNLQVDGTETIVNTETLNVADKTVGIGSTSNASNTTADGAGIEVFASSSQTGNNKTITWQNSSNAWTFGGGGIVATDAVVGSAVTSNASGITVTGVVTATSFKGDGSQLSGIDATAIQTGNTSVQTVDTGSDGHVKMTTEGGERVRVGPAGQIGLGGANYGSSGQLLTSGGSGSAPTWTTVSSAPEVSGTANGAIAAGKPVIANADGSIGQVKYDYTALSPYQHTDYDSAVTGYDAYWNKVGYDSTHNQFLYFYKSTQQSNDGNIQIGTPNGATTGTNVTVNAFQNVITSWISEPIAIVWSKTSALGVGLYYHGNGICAKAFTSNGTSTLTFGSELVIVPHDGGNASNYGTISWDVSSNKFLVVVGNNATNSNYAEAYVVSHSGTTLTKGSAVTVKTSQAKGADLAYDSDNNRHLLTYLDEQDSDKLCGRIITVSGTVPTVNAETKETATGANTRAVYISGGKFVSVYGTGSAGYGRVVTISGTTVAFGTQSSAIPSGISGTNYGQNQLDACYDPGLEKVVVAYIDTSNRSSYCILTPDTSANTISSVGSQGFVRNGSQSLDISLVRSDYWQLNGFCARRGTGGNNVIYWNLSTTTRATNVTGENYLGLANASYANGQTASIRVSGATQDNQSGLTPGQNYFVQNDGTIGLTAANPNVYAGTAVSSTQLLVGKSSSFGVSPWVTVASYTGAPTGDNNTIYENFANQSYKRYKLIYQVEGTSNNLSYFGLEVKAGGSWKSGSNNYTMLRSTRRHNAMDERQTNETRIWLVSEAVKFLQGEITFYDPNSNSYFCNFCSDSYAMISGSSVSTYTFQFAQTNGAYVSNNFNSTVPIQGIRFRWGVNGLNNLDWLLLAAP